ncbi:hypothetical protein H2200_013089 [Cladophialophora chaetospira]|uniref:Uncharacterized protein n=1 Tax=Cladophialophora chaetospira TaxID=386627 RepID=A0AA38WWP9_9EURO|nr:hypothetical protein H2200_013089 [Cladophialophora chaetospira]
MTTEHQHAEEVSTNSGNSQTAASGEITMPNDGDHKNQDVNRTDAGNAAADTEPSPQKPPLEGGDQVKDKVDAKTDAENGIAATPTNPSNNENKQEPEATANKRDKEETNDDDQGSKNVAPLEKAGAEAKPDPKTEHAQERQKEIEARAQKLEQLRKERQERERAAKDLEDQAWAALSKKRKDAADNRARIVQALVRAAKDAEGEAQNGNVLILQMEQDLMEAQHKAEIAEEAKNQAQDAKRLLEEDLEAANNRTEAAKTATAKSEAEKAQVQRNFEESVKNAGIAATKAKAEKDELRKKLVEITGELTVLNTAVTAANRNSQIAKQDHTATDAKDAALKESEKLRADLGAREGELAKARESLKEIDGLNAQLQKSQIRVAELELLLAACATDHGNALAIWPRGGSRVSNVQEESPGVWVMNPNQKLPRTEADDQTRIRAGFTNLNKPPNPCADLKTSPNPSVQWITSKETKLPNYVYQESRRLPLTFSSSIDLGEVTCPAGMVVIGVALGPWVDGSSKSPDFRHMSIKLCCKNPGKDDDPGTWYGNRGPKYAAGDAGPRMIAKPYDQIKKDAEPTATPWPPSTFTSIFCDNRAVTYEACVGERGDEVVEAKAISSLSFYSPTYTNGGKVPGNRLYLLPTWQDPHHPRIVATPEAIAHAFEDQAKFSKFYFRTPNQLGEPLYTTSGIDRLHYDTNIVFYNGWQVTGVQMFIRDYDTLALNVRFEDLSSQW